MTELFTSASRLVGGTE